MKIIFSFEEVITVGFYQFIIVSEGWCSRGRQHPAHAGAGPAVSGDDTGAAACKCLNHALEPPAEKASRECSSVPTEKCQKINEKA